MLVTSNVAMRHDVDPVQFIKEQVGDISGIELFNTQVLVGVYIRPEKTKGGIILTDKNRDEDRFQSKTGVILKMGPNAFVDPEGKWFGNAEFNVGDWVVFRPSDGWNVTIHGYVCRLMDDTSIRMRVSHPDQIW